MLADDIADIVAWLIDGALSAPSPEAVITEMCERVVASGIPVWRAAMFVRTLHPQIMGRRIEWRAGIGSTIGDGSYEVLDSASYRDSPVARVYRDGQPIRLRLDGPEQRDYPHVDELRAAGGTDFLAFPVRFSNGEIHVGVWVTRDPDGFTDDQCAALRRLEAPLARITEIYALRRTAANLLDTYVGRDAGAHILAGQIRRGFSERIRAVIWISDMRGFTGFADGMPPSGLIELLNRYFDCQVESIEKHGGEVLKFMGDGLLAIFPLSGMDDPHTLCNAAFAAATEVREAIAGLPDWPARPDPARPRYGLALHIGQLLYGNIGAANRLDFTCIGPAVNLAARLEALSGRLGRSTLFSKDFAGYCGAPLVSLGAFDLAGFHAPVPVYGLDDEA
jgi:adenylate cyclase